MEIDQLSTWDRMVLLYGKAQAEEARAETSSEEEAVLLLQREFIPTHPLCLVA